MASPQVFPLTTTLVGPAAGKNGVSCDWQVKKLYINWLNEVGWSIWDHSNFYRQSQNLFLSMFAKTYSYAVRHAEAELILLKYHGRPMLFGTL